jgi:pimeloyl-ACP methyl ester carboxylesterase
VNTHASGSAAPRADPADRSNAVSRPGIFVVGDGAPVVLLHSSLASKSQWAALADRLASRFRVIGLDLCGYGDNAMPALGASFTLDDEVRLIEARLDGLVELKSPVHVVGHSYGALAALRFAQRAPDRVASLSLYEPVAFRILNDDDAALAEAKGLARRVFDLIASGRRHDATRAFVDFWSGDGSYASLPLPAQASLARRIDKVPLDFQAAMRWPLSPIDLCAIAAPALLLVGNRSPAATQRIARLLTRALPNCRVGSFACGHMGPVTDPDRVNPWIDGFLNICADRDVPGDAVAAN